MQRGVRRNEDATLDGEEGSNKSRVVGGELPAETLALPPSSSNTNVPLCGCLLGPNP